MTILDRYILRSLLFNYVIAVGVMLCMYVVLDLFVNLDEFTESDPSLAQLFVNLLDYYLPNLGLYFAQLSTAMVTFACLLTVARMRTQNEMTAILSSGVSLYRVAVPIVAFAVTTSLLLVVDTEVLIPHLAPELVRKHEDVGTGREREVLFLPDRDNALLSAGRFLPETGELRHLLVLSRDADGSAYDWLEADVARWDPPLTPGRAGRWLLTRGRRETLVTSTDSADLGPRTERVPSYPRTYESNLSPRDIMLRQAEGWVRYLSLAQLRELQETQVADLATLVQTRHQRIATPIVSIIMLLLGLPFFLDRSPANILSDASKAMLVCGLCYVVTFCTQNLRPDSLSALPSWIPIFIFATVAVVLLDRLRT